MLHSELVSGKKQPLDGWWLLFHSNAQGHQRWFMMLLWTEVLSHAFFLVCKVSCNWGPFIKRFAQQIPAPLMDSWDKGKFLVSLLSQVQGLTLYSVNFPWTLTGNKKKERERRLWSLASSNVMESVSLGFGRKRR